ncbi:MAG: hypothetical protein V2A61_01650, partial [Calditrichota bacterium]
AQAALDLPAEGAVSQDFNIVPERTGKLGGWVKWEDPESFRPDNQRWFTLDIPDSLRILLVGTDPLARKIIAAALQSETAGFIKIDQFEAGRWETQPLAGYQGLILAGVGNVSPGQAERLQEFCQRGGGIVLFQDLNGDLAGLSRGLGAKLGFSGAQDIVTSSGVNWGKMDLDHPLFEGMFEPGGAPRSPSFQRFVDLAVGKGDNVIIPFSDGKPGLIERRVGQGRALMFAVGLDPNDSDFLVSGIFAPLVFRAIVWASTNGEYSEADWATGQSRLVALPSDGLIVLSGAGVSPAIRLQMPDGSVKDLLPKPIRGGVEIETGLIETPGLYDLKSDGQAGTPAPLKAGGTPAPPVCLGARFAANIVSAQSKLKRIELDQKYQRQAGIAAVLDAPETDLAPQIISARFGRELWRPIAAAFLGFLTAESLLGGVWGKKEERDEG